MKERCDECGATSGSPHRSGCDVERCSICFGQRISCDCSGHDPLMSVWTGRWPKRKNRLASQQLNSDDRVIIKKRQCYYNAFSVVQFCEEYSNATYIEGSLVLPNSMTIEHGWIETDDEIIDPTLPDIQGVYFPELQFKGPELSAALNIPIPDGCEDLPIFCRFGWGSESPEFISARLAAMKLVKHRIESMSQRIVPASVKDAGAHHAGPNHSGVGRTSLKRSIADRRQQDLTNSRCSAP